MPHSAYGKQDKRVRSGRNYEEYPGKKDRSDSNDQSYAPTEAGLIHTLFLYGQRGCCSPVAPAIRCNSRVRRSCCCSLASERSLVKNHRPSACSMHPDGTSQRHPGLTSGCGPRGQPVHGQGNFGRKSTYYEVVDARLEAGLAGHGGNDGGAVEDSSGAPELDELVCKKRLHRFRR
jgi:hypothetical protein